MEWFVLLNLKPIYSNLSRQKSREKTRRQLPLTSFVGIALPDFIRIWQRYT
jgi:hypothetical protein